MGKEGDAPFGFVESGGTGDELADASGVGAAYTGVAKHEDAAGLVVEVIPVVGIGAALAHVVETEDGPVGHVGVEAVAVVFFHTVAEFLDLGGVLFGAFGESVFFGELLGIHLFGGGVFAELGHAEVAVGRGQHVGSEGTGEAFFKFVGLVKVVGEEHEGDVGLRCEHGEGEQLGGVGGSNLLNELGEVSLCLEFFFFGVEAPLRLLDVVEEVDDVPSFAWDNGIGFCL